MEHIKRSVQTAFHKIKHSFKEFLPFFLAIFLVQCIFFTVLLSFQSNEAHLKQETEASYSYHILVTGLYEDEMLILKENRRAVFLNEFYYTPLTIKEYTSPNGDPSYDMTVKLLTGNKDYGIFSLFRDDSLRANYEAMLYKYGDIIGEASDHVSIYLSPLYLLEESTASLATARNLLIVAVFLICFLMLFVLYRLYVSRQTFSFGIFSTFGADSKRLQENAFTQLYLIALFTLLPAYYLSALICFAFYTAGASAFYFSWFSLKNWLVLLLVMAPLLLLVVRTPIKLLSRKPVCELLQAADASDLVSSPRQSAPLVQKGFPFGYEALSFWRFRKHHIVSACVSVLLCALLVLGTLIGDVYQANKDMESKALSDFTVQFRGINSVSDSQYESLASANGIKNAHRVYPEALLTKYHSLLLVDDSLIASNVGFANDTAAGVSYTGDARIKAAAYDTLAYYKSLYQIEGNPDALLDGPNRVIIGSSYQNRDTFSYSVGDTVRVAIPMYDEEGELVLNGDKLPSELETGEGLWQQMYERISYQLVTLEIVGIIEDYPSGMNGVPLLLSTDTYQALTGESVTAKTVSVSVDTSSAENYDLAFDELSRICAVLGNATVSISGASFRAEIEKNYCYSQFIPTLSLLLFLFFPLLWVYAQNAIAQRREEEYKILYSLSVPPKKMRALCLASSLMMLPICLCILLATFGVTVLVLHFVNHVLPNIFHISVAAVGGIAPSLWGYGAIIAALLLSFLLSFFIPYFHYQSAKRSFSLKP